MSNYRRAILEVCFILWTKVYIFNIHTEVEKNFQDGFILDNI